MKKIYCSISVVLFIVFPIIRIHAQRFYGMTTGGGANNSGVIFYYDISLGKDSVVYSFPSGCNPSGSLILASDGYLYGVEPSGGTLGDGAIFKYNTATGAITTLANFYGTSVITPEYSLIQTSDGDLYGIARGINSSSKFVDSGCIYKCTLTGVIDTIVRFNYKTGGIPFYGPIIQGSDGNLYGTLYLGSQDSGTIFKCTTSGSLTIIAKLGKSGWLPGNSLIQASDGNLYLTTEGGGTNGYGTILKCTTNGVLSNLYSFNLPADEPSCALIQASDGNLYGLTSTNGNDYGSIFNCTTSGIYNTLFTFDGTNGQVPEDNNLIQGSDGNLYGMTYEGGTSSDGTVFQYTSSGNLKTLIDFNNTNGFRPNGRLVEIQTLTGMEDILSSSKNFIVYPNPSSGIFTVQMANSMQPISNSKIAVYSILGQCIYQNNLNLKINLSGQPAGIYLYKVINENGELSGSGKFVLQY
ncbi:MAG TPA: choice-of-anchor tandem repeat GloVer-containing protein [Bacteroidia bacterium]|nr:choice-of-anchor tandem repeat GloVer-containing protein [Bacteroidia bacterium]